jgi:hypothetical protein
MLVLQAVNAAASPAVVTFAVAAWATDGSPARISTLNATDLNGGNTPANPLYISPQRSMLEWPAGQATLNVTLPPMSFTILELFAQ